MRLLFFILEITNSKEAQEAKIAIIDKILSDEKLFNNKYIEKDFAGIIIKTNMTSSIVIDKILSEEKLYDVKSILKEHKHL